MKLKPLIARIYRSLSKLSMGYESFPIAILKATGKKTRLVGKEVTARRIYNWIGAGLIVVSLICLQALIPLSSLDTSQIVALICFSISIPLLAGILAIFNLELAYKKYSPFVSRLISDNLFGYGFVVWLFTIAMYIVAIGIVFVLWHLLRIAALLFGITIMTITLFIAGYFWDMEKLEVEDEEQEWD